METIQNSTQMSEQLGLHIQNILEDGKLSQDMDETEITALEQLFTSEETQAYSQTKELLKESLLASLKRGVSVQGQDQKDFLQKIITLTGLDFDINSIYETNRDVLTIAGREKVNEPVPGQGNARWQLPEIKAISPEEKTYIFKYDSNQSGALIIYKYDDGTGIFNMEEANMLGYIPVGDEVIKRKNNQDDVLDDNNDLRIKDSDIDNALAQDALREQVLEAQIQAEQEALRAQEAEVLFQEERGFLHSQLLALEGDILLLQSQLVSLKTNNEGKEDIIFSLQERIKDLETEIGELQKILSLSSTSVQRETLIPDIEEIKNELTSCKAEILTLQTQKPALSFGQMEGNNNFKLHYQIGKEVGEDNLVGVPISQEEKVDDTTQKREAVGEDFKLSNPIEFWEGGNEYLSDISMESKSDIISLLKKYEGQRFPKDHFEASEYAFAFQCAISLLDTANSMGNIDGYWGKKSSKALQKVQQELLGYSGADADGKPGPKTLSRLLEKIS